MSAPKSSHPIKTILTISIGFTVVFLITKMKWTLGVSVGVGILGLLSEYLAIQIDRLWMFLTKILSYIVPNILLSLIYFLFLTPIAWISKIFGKKDPLKLKNPGNSVYVTVNKEFEPKSFENTF
ncbi:MAG: SxtJ family membrane protein [Crocinitomicaceae bacterium]